MTGGVILGSEEDEGREAKAPWPAACLPEEDEARRGREEAACGGGLVVWSAVVTGGVCLLVGSPRSIIKNGGAVGVGRRSGSSRRWNGSTQHNGGVTELYGF